MRSLTWFETIAGNQRVCSRPSSIGPTWLGAQTMQVSAAGSRPGFSARGGGGAHDPLDDLRVGELDDRAVADPPGHPERLRPVARDPHRDLRKLRPHPLELEILVVPMDFLAVHERLDHLEAPLELRHANRLLADVAPGRVS